MTFDGTGLLYLDAGFVAEQYESITGISAALSITKTEGSNAGARVLGFNGGVSTTQTKTFSLSALKMLERVFPVIEQHAQFKPEEYSMGDPSRYCWIHGILSVGKAISTKNRYTMKFVAPDVEVSRPEEPTRETIMEGEETYFEIDDLEGQRTILLGHSEYFSSGIESLLALTGTLVNQMVLPVKAYCRVLPAVSPLDQWFSVPLLILEDAE